MVEQQRNEVSPEEVTAEKVRQQFEVREDKIRDAAKWLIASFAAVGAVLIAGSQLSSIGKLPVCFDFSLECNRLWIAVLGTIASLLGVVLAIWIGVRLLVPERLELGALSEEWNKERMSFRGRRDSQLKAYFERDKDLLQGFDDLDDLATQQRAAYEEADRLADALRNPSDDEAGKRLHAEWEVADKHLADILRRGDVVVTTANHALYVNDFRFRSLRNLMLAGALAAVGIVAFAWAANPPATSVAASLREANLAASDLIGTNLRNVDLTDADLSGANLTEADLSGAQLSGADLDGVFWANTTCPDGASSDDAGGTCINHLSP